MSKLLSSCPLAHGVLFSLRGSGPSRGWASLGLLAKRRALVIERENAYWFKPTFLSNGSNLATCREASFLLVSERKEKATLVLPLPGRHHRAWLESRQGRVGVAWEFDYKVKKTEVPIAFVVRSSPPGTIVSEAVAALQPVLRSFRAKAAKPTPAFVDWFGWCTWDAFYYAVTADDVIEGLGSLARAGVSPGFLVLDDGWQDSMGWLLRSTGANSKFPGGLGSLVASVRKLGVRYVGVWHAVQGYWHGVSPTGPLADEYRIRAVPQTTKEFAGWPENLNPSVRYALHPDDVAAFYSAFYSELKSAGVDFTKVDGQAATSLIADEVFPAAHTIGKYQSAMQRAVSKFLRAGSIHCMANCADLLWRQRSASVWRNSDDFYPQKPFAAQAKHLVSNAYNAVLTGAFATPDWDMFQSTHEHALFHALARALSGGPVYVSDKPGQHNSALLRRLVLADGRIPRFLNPGQPLARCLFHDPMTEAIPLVLVNAHGPNAAIGFFNCRVEPAPGPVNFVWSPDDIPSLSGGTFVIHQPISGETHICGRTQERVERLETAGSCAVWTIAPLVGNLLAALGLESYFAAAATVDAVKVDRSRLVRVTIRFGGIHLFWCAAPPLSVVCAGIQVKSTFDEGTHLLRVEITTSHSAVVGVQF